MIAGFDISTSCVGWCILSDSGEYIDIGYVDLKKYDNLYDKSDVFERDVLSVVKRYKMNFGEPMKIYVEEPLMMFKTRSSMAQVIAKLQRFNGMISSLLYRNLFSGYPELVNPMTARSKCGIKVPKGQDTKEYVWNFVNSLNVIPKSKWKLKKTGKLKDFCFDMSDAYVVALAGLKIENEKKGSQEG